MPMSMPMPKPEHEHVTMPMLTACPCGSVWNADEMHFPMHLMVLPLSTGIQAKSI